LELAAESVLGRRGKGMEKLILTVEDVADALQMSIENVLRLFRNRKLRGRKEHGRCFIYQHSLRDHVLRLIAKRFLGVGSNKVNEKDLKSNESTRQTAPVIRLSNVEEHCGMLPDEAAIRLQNAFSYNVYRMGVKDSHLRSDLIQEMSLATLKCTGRNKRNFYLSRAQSRGWDYLRYERLRGMKSIESFDEDEWEKIEPAIKPKADCSAIVKLFKLAGIELSYLHDYGIHLVDENEQDFVSVIAKAERAIVNGPASKGKGELCMDDKWKESA